MSVSLDWLSHLLDLVPVQGQFEGRCLQSAPWQIAREESPQGEMPYHVILSGSAWLEGEVGNPPRRLGPGDILLSLHGSSHKLRDGGEEADMLQGRFIVAQPHERWMRSYLPSHLVGQAPDLLSLMRDEADGGNPGGQAVLNALSTALFALVLRLASKTRQPSQGLLSVAGHPRLAPALTAMFNDPARAWTLPELAEACGLPRATIARQFQGALGRSANDLLADIRMTVAARKLDITALTVEAVGEAVGYQSEAAFQRAFKQRMGMSPAAWRRRG